MEKEPKVFPSIRDHFQIPGVSRAGICISSFLVRDSQGGVISNEFGHLPFRNSFEVLCILSRPISTSNLPVE